MTKFSNLSVGGAVAFSVLTSSAAAWAVSSSELYTSAAYQYGRFEARMQFAAGDGVISSFFLWKDGSDQSGAFWNELDFEKLRANCELATNALYGMPVAGHEAVYDPAVAQSASNLCGEFHTYAYEWTPEAIAWFIDGIEIRRETGAIAEAFRVNATQGMQLHFNVWPGDASFGGNFNPSILPVHQFINWVQYSSYSDGAFELEWREDFNANNVPNGWGTGSWPSPKNLSTHSSANVTFKNGYAILSLTDDNATGSAGVNPMDLGGDAPEPPDAGNGGENDAGTAPTASDTGEPAASTPPSSGASAPSASSTAPVASATASASATPTEPPPVATAPASQSAAPTAPPPSASTTPTAVAPSATPSIPPAASAPIVATQPSSSGCNCRVAQSSAPAPWTWISAFLALSFIRVLRSRRL